MLAFLFYGTYRVSFPKTEDVQSSAYTASHHKNQETDQSGTQDRRSTEQLYDHISALQVVGNGTIRIMDECKEMRSLRKCLEYLPAYRQVLRRRGDKAIEPQHPISAERKQVRIPEQRVPPQVVHAAELVSSQTQYTQPAIWYAQQRLRQKRIVPQMPTTQPVRRPAQPEVSTASQNRTTIPQIQPTLSMSASPTELSLEQVRNAMSTIHNVKTKVVATLQNRAQEQSAWQEIFSTQEAKDWANLVRATICDVALWASAAHTPGTPDVQKIRPDQLEPPGITG